MKERKQKKKKKITKKEEEENKEEEEETGAPGTGLLGWLACCFFGFRFLFFCFFN